MKLIDGKAVADEIKTELKQNVIEYSRKFKRTPHLAAILVGNNPASKAYVANKVKSCQDVGFRSTLVELEETITQEELLSEIDKLNNDPDVDGFIVQLPLPKHIDETTITLAIEHTKDVDGFHPINVGRMNQGLPCYLPATPYGIVKLLERYNIDTIGKNVVVLGRSNIVGTPISIMLSRKGFDATVTITHSRTKNLDQYLLQADIIIAAIGIPQFVKKSMLKRNVILIDVGINRIDDTSMAKGYRLVGDVDFDDVKEWVSYITPVPGGVGPMTVMGLLLNTFKAANQEVYPKE
jgi:methylenetetrahydrofolate dehydrogenase (NADP+)/methenyltetrahydrofolate cyclohydrolase